MERESTVTEAQTGEGQPTKGRRAPSIIVLNTILVVLGTVLTTVGILFLVSFVGARGESSSVRDRYEACYEAARDLMDASDFLTAQARIYVLSADEKYLGQYLEEILNTKRRDHAVETLKENAAGTQAERQLTKALAKSNELSQRELYAMRLVAESQGIAPLPKELSNVTLSSKDGQRSSAQKRERAEQLMLGPEYDSLKAQIVDGVNKCSQHLESDLQAARVSSLENEHVLQTVLFITLVMDVVLLVAFVVTNNILVMRPIRHYNHSILENDSLVVEGSSEIRNVAISYNRIYDENQKRTQHLRQVAHTDSLTGLLNRGSFDHVMDTQPSNSALIIIDVDLFKQVNDVYGHATGDAVLKKVGGALTRWFRSTDYVCRIGGDEFAVVLTQMTLEIRGVVVRKLESIQNDLTNTADGLPPVSISAGVAFSESAQDANSLYRAADEAVYAAKHGGRNRVVFYEDL
ncbi:MAG: GGDEF domain-containing protein [Coriobacteriales bacterium]|nr:GGDEF domain-containing protein [Coriobacteriales bacterium]